MSHNQIKTQIWLKGYGLLAQFEYFTDDPVYKMLIQVLSQFGVKTFFLKAKNHPSFRIPQLTAYVGGMV